MRLRDRMIYCAIVTSGMKLRLKPHLREFYRDLLHVCDDYGRFEANASLLRGALFTPILKCVSERDVEGYLRQLAAPENADIKLYTVKGRRYGKITKWRQTGLRKLVADYPPEDGEPESVSTKPPPLPDQSEGKKEGGEGAKSAAILAPANKVHHKLVKAPRETEEQWRARLTTEYPTVNIAKELERARIRQGKQGKTLERRWFEQHWLINVSETVSLEPVANATPVEGEPDGWRDWLEENCPGSVYCIGGREEKRPWSQLSAAVRERISSEMKQQRK